MYYQTRPQVVVNSLGDDQRYSPSITSSSEGVTMIKHTVKRPEKMLPDCGCKGWSRKKERQRQRPMKTIRAHFNKEHPHLIARHFSSCSACGYYTLQSPNVKHHVRNAPRSCAMWMKKVKACSAQPQESGLFNQALGDYQPDIGTGADLTQFTLTYTPPAFSARPATLYSGLHSGLGCVTGVRNIGSDRDTISLSPMMSSLPVASTQAGNNHVMSTMGTPLNTEQQYAQELETSLLFSATHSTTPSFICSAQPQSYNIPSPITQNLHQIGSGSYMPMMLPPSSHPSALFYKPSHHPHENRQPIRNNALQNMQQSQTLGESFRSTTTNIGGKNDHFSGFQIGSDILPPASCSRFDSHGSSTCIGNRSSPWLFDNHNMSINLHGLNQIASSGEPEIPSVSGWPTTQGPAEDGLIGLLSLTLEDLGDHGNETPYSSVFSNNETFDLRSWDMEPAFFVPSSYELGMPLQTTPPPLGIHNDEFHLGDYKDFKDAVLLSFPETNRMRMTTKRRERALVARKPSALSSL